MKKTKSKKSRDTVPLSQHKSAVLQQAAKLFQQHWRPQKGNYELIQPFENADKLLEQKRIGGQFH